MKNSLILGVRNDGFLIIYAFTPAGFEINEISKGQTSKLTLFFFNYVNKNR